MRLALVATVGVSIVLLAAGCGRRPALPVQVYIDGKYIVSVPVGHPANFLPKTLTVSRGYSQDIIHVDPTVATRMVDHGLDTHMGRINLPFTLVSSYIKTDSQRAIFHHGTEVAALSMILLVVGIDAGQPGLQAHLARSGPVAPQPVPGSKLRQWGDPDQGFVGQLNGVGTHAFGVYQEPIRRLAAKHKVKLLDITGKKSAAQVREIVLLGHPVIAWVGDPGGQHASWLTPSGKKITVDLTAHAVVILAAGPTGVTISDPTDGKLYHWSVSQFAARWAQIGDRALELP